MDETELTYPKSVLLNFKKYRKHTDLLGVLLSEEKEYTLAEVDEQIEEFMKG